MEISHVRANYFHTYLGSEVAYAFRDGVWEVGTLEHYVDEVYNIFSYEWFLQNYDEEFKLFLTPLVNISEEDALEVNKTCLKMTSTLSREEIAGILFTIFFLPNLNDILVSQFEPREIIHLYQLLLTKEYALPHMGLSIEELIGRGWLKLKD